MSNPDRLVMGGFAYETEALALWARLAHNDRYAVVEVNIGFAVGNPAEKPVCWLVLPKLPTAPDEIGIPIVNKSGCSGLAPALIHKPEGFPADFGSPPVDNHGEDGL